MFLLIKRYFWEKGVNKWVLLDEKIYHVHYFLGFQYICQEKFTVLFLMTSRLHAMSSVIKAHLFLCHSSSMMQNKGMYPFFYERGWQVLWISFMYSRSM